MKTMSGIQYQRLLAALNRIKQHGRVVLCHGTETGTSPFLPGYIQICKQSTAVEPKKEPEKVEVFVDGKPVYVEPNTTVLQVNTPVSRSALNR